MSNDQQLTYSESRALEIRNMIRDEIDLGVETALDGSGFKEARQKFAKVKSVINSQEVRRAYRTDKSMNDALKASVKEGGHSIFKELKALDDYLPPERKFLDKAIMRIVGDDLTKVIPNYKSGFGGTINQGVGRLGVELIQPTMQGNPKGILSAAMSAGRGKAANYLVNKDKNKEDQFKFDVPR
jgi:hypothetical protein